jgi:hypothetical protein
MYLHNILGQFCIRAESTLPAVGTLHAVGMAEKNVVFVTPLGLIYQNLMIQSTLKPIFRRFWQIRYAYESLLVMIFMLTTDDRQN